MYLHFAVDVSQFLHIVHLELAFIKIQLKRLGMLCIYVTSHLVQGTMFCMIAFYAGC